MSASKDNTSTIDFKGRSITLSKYVSSVKQRGDIKSSGSRNVKRFMLSDTEEESLRTSLFQNLRAQNIYNNQGWTFGRNYSTEKEISTVCVHG